MSKMLTLLSTTAVVAAAITTLTANPKTAAACAETGSIYIGTVCMTAANYCPDGYVEAQGQLLQINTYNALYSLVGVTYGGDARTTFGVPDYRGRSPVGLGQGPGLSVVQFGEKRGVETVTLTQAQMPIHNHTVAFQPNTSMTLSQTAISLPVTGAVSGVTISGNASLPVTGTVSGQTLSGNANLPVKADANIGTTGSAGRSINLDPGDLLATVGGAGAQIYGNSTNPSNVRLGEAGGVTGFATGPLTGVTVSGGTINGTASGPLTGATASGGTISGNAAGTVNLTGTPNASFAVGNAGGSQPATNIPPQQAIRFCMAVNGLYPPRP